MIIDPLPISIANCPDHGLHGQRNSCFVCCGVVEQVPMVPAEEYVRVLDLLREFVEAENQPCDFDHHGNCQEHGWFGDKPGECGIARAREVVGLAACQHA